MELDRRVKVLAHRTGDRRSVASGYLVAPRLVLTTGHILTELADGGDGALTVSLPDSPDTGQHGFPAQVRWHRKDAEADAALLEVTSEDWPVPDSLSGPSVRPQRFGWVIGTSPVPVTMTGFPRMQRDRASGRRLDEQLTGHIVPGSGSLAGRYEVLSTAPTVPEEDSATGIRSRWSGMSGAAVISDQALGGDLLCGVVRQDRRSDGGTRLTATPASVLLDDCRFRAVVEQHSDWEPALEPVEPASLLTPSMPVRDLYTPLALLRADVEAVSFRGRVDLLRELEAWCDQPHKVSVRVLIGPGGQGKTRLARRLTRRLSGRGWVTGHLRPDLTDNDGPVDFQPLATAGRVLVVVDYAETRPHLLRRLITQVHGTPHRVRLLLIARSDGGWRKDPLTAYSSVREILLGAHVTELAPLVPRTRHDRTGSGRAADEHTAADRARRRAAYFEAACDLARLLPKVHQLTQRDWTALADTLPAPEEDLVHARYNSALTLQMEALVSLLRHGGEGAHAPAAIPAEEFLLQHEQRYWDESANSPNHRLGLPTSVLSIVVAVASLCGAADREQAVRVLAAVPDLTRQSVTGAARWVRSLYPGLDLYWGSMQPDRVAEYHASAALLSGRIMLPALLRVAAEEQQVQLITVVTRAMVAHDLAGRTADRDGLQRLLDGVDFNSLPRQAVQAANAALTSGAAVLAPVALQMSTALDGHRPAPESEEAVAGEHVYALISRGSALAELKRWDEARPLVEEAVALSRDPEFASRDNALPIALRLLHEILYELGHWDDALSAVREAAKNTRLHTGADAATGGLDLAEYLHRESLTLCRLDQWPDALVVARRSVKILEGRGATPTRSRPLSGLPVYHEQVADVLYKLNRVSEAVTEEYRGVEAWRHLADESPDQYQPSLAAALSTLGVLLSSDEEWAESLAAEQEAVQLWRLVAAADPVRHEADLALALQNIGVSYGKLDRWEEACVVWSEVLEIRRRFAKENPAQYEPALADAAHNLGVFLSRMDRWDEACAVESEALEIRRRLARENPAQYEPALADAAHNLGVFLSRMDRWDEACAVERQAVAIRRRLAKENPETYTGDLLDSVRAFRMTLKLLVIDHPQMYEPDLAMAHTVIGALRAKSEKWRKAVKALEAARDISRRLAEADLSTHAPPLVDILNQLGECFSALGKHDAALASVKEERSVLDLLKKDEPRFGLLPLADNARRRSLALAELERWEEALEWSGTAVDLYKEHMHGDLEAQRAALETLGLQARVLTEVGRGREAQTLRDWLAAHPLPGDDG